MKNVADQATALAAHYFATKRGTKAEEFLAYLVRVELEAAQADALKEAECAYQVITARLKHDEATSSAAAWRVNPHNVILQFIALIRRRLRPDEKVAALLEETP